MKDNNILLLVLGIVVFLGLTASGGLKTDTGGSSKTSSQTKDSVEFYKNADGTIAPLSERDRERQAQKIVKKIDDIRKDLEKLVEEKNASVYKDKVSISRIDPKAATDRSRAFITLTASSRNKETVRITGWQIKSVVTGNTVVIGQASEAPLPSAATLKDIVLLPKDSVVVNQRRSPINVSFRTNICSGYLNSNTFSPAISRQCPYIRDKAPEKFTDREECDRYIRSFGRCEKAPRSLPDESPVPRSCEEYVKTVASYEGCVIAYKDDFAFQEEVWRVFLGITNQFWLEEDEVIVLLDQFGKVVDIARY